MSSIFIYLKFGEAGTIRTCIGPLRCYSLEASSDTAPKSYLHSIAHLSLLKAFCVASCLDEKVER